MSFSRSRSHVLHQNLTRKAFKYEAPKQAYSYSKIISTNAENLSGIMPELITPFNRLKDEKISWKHLENNLSRLNKSNDFAGYVVNGYYGESAHLSDKERFEIVKAVRDLIGKKKTILFCSSAESLKESIDDCEKMKVCGADYALIRVPCYYKLQMTQSALFEYYTRIADKSPIPIIIDNMPSVTLIDFAMELCVDLADHPNIVGLKESSKNIAKISSICEAIKQGSYNDFCVIAGSAHFLLEALRAGAIGGITPLANVLGNEIIGIYNLHEADKKINHSNNQYLKEAQALQSRLVKPDLLIIETYGVPALKAVLDAYGYYGGPCRLPLLELFETEIEKLRDIFEQSGFMWLSSRNHSIFCKRINYPKPMSL